STSPAETVSERSSTACTSPSSVRKDTRRSRTSRSAVTGSGGPDARVEPRVDEVDDGVGHDDEERGVEDGGHDHGQVEVLERVVGQLADAVQPEDDLGQERSAPDEGAEVEAEEADEDDQRGPERMAKQHAPFGQPLGARGADVVLLLGFDQRRA